MKLLLTGATGYTGRGLAEVLRTRHRVRGLDVRGDDGVELEELRVGDIADLATCRDAVEGVEAVVLCHMAPNPDAYKTPELAIDVNVKGTANVFHAMVEAGLARAVLISSRGVMIDYQRPAEVGPGPYCYDSGNLYILTKVLQEQICRHYHESHGLAIALLRPSYICYDETLINKYGQRPGGYGPGLIDPRDIGRAVLAALDLPDLALEAFDLGQDDDTIDLSAARERLGWRPEYRFEGLPRPAKP